MNLTAVINLNVDEPKLMGRFRLTTLKNMSVLLRIYDCTYRNVSYNLQFDKYRADTLIVM